MKEFCPENEHEFYVSESIDLKKDKLEPPQFMFCKNCGIGKFNREWICHQLHGKHMKENSDV